VYIKYKLLPKGTYVRFQPELRSFHEVVGADPELMKAALEASLLNYCTLSEGDWVQVSETRGPGHRGKGAQILSEDLLWDHLCTFRHGLGLCIVGVCRATWLSHLAALNTCSPQAAALEVQSHHLKRCKR
jgi:hypothetical protein